MHSKTIILRILFGAFIFFCITGCASSAVYTAFTDVNNNPIKEVRSVNLLKEGLEGTWRLCVVGEIKKEGYAEYQIVAPLEHPNSSVYTKEENVHLGCPSLNDDSNSEYVAEIGGKNGRQLVIKNLHGQKYQEITIGEVWGYTNPVVYAFLPFTAAIDIITSPIQLWVLLAKELGMGR